MSEKTLTFPNPRALSQLYCDRPENLSRAEDSLNVKIVSRDEWLRIEGGEDNVGKAELFFTFLNEGRSQGLSIRNNDYNLMLDWVASGEEEKLRQLFQDPVVMQLHRKTIVPKTIGQKHYIRLIRDCEVVFGIGPAGTGKTYLAVAAALEALLRGDVGRVIFSRPAVEAGEALGFLPGDVREKILPYLRPIYDALYDMLEREYADRLMEKGVIEIAPLAYMRGRTLSNACVILDEAQNTTREQMMMFLTRLGEDSRMIVTGDITQIDLPSPQKSGLREAREILQNVKGIGFYHFGPGDVVRHPLVLRIIEAYGRARESTGDTRSRPRGGEREG